MKGNVFRSARVLKGFGLAVFPVPVCMWILIFESRSLKAMQSVQVWSCANFFLSPQMPPPYGRSAYGDLERIPQKKT